MIKKLIYFGSLLFVGAAYSQVSQSDSTLLLNSADSLDNTFNIPVFNSTGGDIDSDIGLQETSSLLQSGRDLFAQFSLFHFNQARYRIRGYANENLQTLLNGIDISNPETGFPSFGEWGGLYGAAPFSEYRLGNGASRYGFSGAAGYNNFDSKASSFRKGTRIAYGTTNRNFRNRISISHSTGMMQNGWAFRLMVSSTSGNQVYIPGTYIQANTFYMSLDKKINNKNLLSFTGYFSPTEIAGRSSAQLEVYELTDNHYYNRAWGYQDGKVRNSVVRKTTRPTFMLTHVLTPNNTSKLTTTLFFNSGKSSVSGINWNNSPNPWPDYYKYLPSFYYNQGLTEQGDAQTSLWQNDVNTRQLNWDRMITMNQNNLYTIPSQIGQGLNTADTRSRYILEDRVEDLKNFIFSSVYNKRIENLFISAGVNGNVYRNHKYKILNDLLGGTFWLDYDQFAQNLGVSSSFQQNNINNPDQKIYKGDKFGYDFNININRAKAWTQAEYSIGHFDLYAGLEFSTMQVWREGFVANGKFPTSSQGKSNVISFTNYGIKGGATYKINGRNFITANGCFLTRPPEGNTMFISPETRNDITKGVTSEQVASYEVSYLVKSPGFKARATYYNTSINNQSNMRVYWHDLYQANVNYFLTGLNEKHQGVELTLEKTLFTSHILQGVFGYGNYYYTNRPKAQAWQTNNNTELYTNRTVYLKDYHIGGTPQMVSGLTYKYQGKKFWNVSATFSYFGELYIYTNPDRRTEEAIAAYQQGDPQIKDVVGQEKMPDFYTVNLNASKSFRIKGKYYLNFNGGINNLLNNKNALNFGYEQMRWDVGQLNRFQNKYQYMMGLTYRVNVSFSF
jgi:hypothetical protein